MASAPASSITSPDDASQAAPSRDGGAFNPKVVLGLLLFGTLAFLATLYFIGSGQTGERATGQAHAASNGLNGYSALTRLLEAQNYEMDISRSPGRYDDYGLLVLTPPPFTDAEELAEIIKERRYLGPTLVLLPKWQAMPVPDSADVEHEDGWVVTQNIMPPYFIGELEEPFTLGIKNGVIRQRENQWQGLGLSGNLPDRMKVQAISQGDLLPIVSDADGDMLAGYLDDGAYYPVLEEATGTSATVRPLDEDDPEYYDDYSDDPWSVVFVAEPDLFNNYGMADPARAQLALRTVAVMQKGENMPVIFDVTLNGLGGTQNLLTLAFTPPFLAATLSLILALIVVGWRAFKRFGPPLAPSREIAFGKQRLVANGAGLIQRSGRVHLLTGRYAEMIGARLAKKLGLRHFDAEAIDVALAQRLPDSPPFSQLADRLEHARKPNDIVRAANALRGLDKQLERKPFR